MRKIVLFAVFVAFTVAMTAQNVQYTPTLKFRVFKRGYTGDWIGHQTDTTNNQGMNWNWIRSDFLFTKIFSTNGLFTLAFRDSVATGFNLAGSGVGVFKDRSTELLRFKRLVAGGNVTVTDGGDSITIGTTSAVGEANTASNIAGAGVGVFRSKVGVDLTLKRLKAGTNVTVIDNTDSVTIAATGEANTASNLSGAGVGVFKQKTSVDFELKRLKAGTNITITDNTDSVTIAAASASGLDPTTTAELMEEFVGGLSNIDGAVGALGWTPRGLVSGVSGETDRLGLLKVNTPSSGGDTTASVSLRPNSGLTYKPQKGNQGNLTVILSMRNGQAANANVNLRVGVMDDPTTPPADGVFFRALGTGNWFAVTRAASTETATNTNVTQATSWKQFKIVVNSAGTSVDFYVDGVLKATHTTNIPSAVVMPALCIQNIAGVNSYMDIDYFYEKITGLSR